MGPRRRKDKKWRNLSLNNDGSYLAVILIPGCAAPHVTPSTEWTEGVGGAGGRAASSALMIGEPLCL